MNFIKVWLAFIACAFILMACGAEDSTTNTSVDIPEDQIAAIVNGEIISKEHLAHFKTIKSNPQVSDKQLLEELVATELLKQEAVKAGITDRDDVRFQLDLQESELLARLLMRDKFSSISFTEEELQNHFEAQSNEQDNREFKARHILVKTADEATAIIDALRNGGDFVELAKERSTGPSGPNGGDLGWFQASSMVPPFAEAVKSMSKGDVSTTPVQTQFGWHVIKLEDTRQPPQPAFDDVREQVQQSLLRETINNYIQEVREAGNIEFKN